MASRRVSTASSYGGGPSSCLLGRHHHNVQVLVNIRTRVQSPRTLLIPGITLYLPVQALVLLRTKDGHLLEFSPFDTSPNVLDALAGITDNAKIQPREEVARLVKEAMRKWAVEL
ncbi:hypothetical protein EDC04DRAFT_1929132 [Pisolithus marmoratus]|nr:hypothetical protein EDC04DRAFT_1929132 [Pisolithus marmoratus]